MSDEAVLDGLVTVGVYNGHEQDIKRLYGDICAWRDEAGAFDNMRRPNWLVEENPCHDSYMRVLWSVLVVVWGDYGTSPRYGWLDKAKDCAAALEKAMRWIDLGEGE